MRRSIHSGILAVLLFLLPLNAQTSIAVMDFEGKGVSLIEASALTDRLRTELFQTGKYRVLEREMMDRILDEQGFQETGCVSTECIVEVGLLIGVEQMVSGSISKVGNVYSVSARIVNVETGEISKPATYNHVGDIGNLLRFGMKNTAMALAGLAKTEHQLAPAPIPMGTAAELMPPVYGEKKSPGGAFIRGLILPGWGQFYTGNKMRGYFYFGLFMYGVVDVKLATMGIKPFSTMEFGLNTFVISEGTAYIIGPIDAAISATNYNMKLEENKADMSK